MKRKRVTVIGSLVAMLLLGVVLFAGADVAEAMRERNIRLSLRFDGLENLGDNFVYEGWVIVDGQPVSTGTFTIDDRGRQSQTRFLIQETRNSVEAFVLTIEPYPDSDPAPSATKVLAGEFNGNRARLSVSHPAALGSDFRGIGGSYILGVPTDQSGATPYDQGIWFLDPAAGPGPSLNLPTLPAGWVYEGWVVGPNGPVSTGTFTDVAAADSDAGGPYAGPDAAPPFPGQDFVRPGMSLLGQAAVISIEPYPDNSPAPFTFKPLIDHYIEDPGQAGGSQELSANRRTLADGFARLGRTIFTTP